MNIGIIDYGLSNIYSVTSAFENLSLKFKTVTDSSTKTGSLDLLVIPGVASFGAGIENIRERGLDLLIQEHKQQGKPILGLCFGAQILLSSSEESPGISGFNFVSGNCVKLSDSNFRVPNQGWRKIDFKYTHSFLGKEIVSQYCYFSHSYKMVLDEENIIMKIKSSSEEIVAGYQIDNILGLQFHPERSGSLGLEILEKCVERLGS
jgi:glutamine amidotransferase